MTSHESSTYWIGSSQAQLARDHSLNEHPNILKPGTVTRAAWHACLEHGANSTLVNAVAEDLPQFDLDVPQQGDGELSG